MKCVSIFLLAVYLPTHTHTQTHSDVECNEYVWNCRTCNRRLAFRVLSIVLSILRFTVCNYQHRVDHQHRGAWDNTTQNRAEEKVAFDLIFDFIFTHWLCVRNFGLAKREWSEWAFEILKRFFSFFFFFDQRWFHMRFISSRKLVEKFILPVETHTAKIVFFTTYLLPVFMTIYWASVICAFACDFPKNTARRVVELDATVSIIAWATGKSSKQTSNSLISLFWSCCEIFIIARINCFRSHRVRFLLCLRELSLYISVFFFFFCSIRREMWVVV